MDWGGVEKRERERARAKGRVVGGWWWWRMRMGVMEERTAGRGGAEIACEKGKSGRAVKDETRGGTEDVLGVFEQGT